MVYFSLRLGKMLLVFLASVLATVHGQRFLSVSGTDFMLNDEKVYLSGMNIAWHDFGMDFGEGRYDASTGAYLEDYLRRIAEAGGNSIRKYTLKPSSWSWKTESKAGLFQS